jgi:putative membrane protein
LRAETLPREFEHLQLARDIKAELASQAIDDATSAPQEVARRPAT